MNDRAVVVCRTAAGLRAATWLARRGVAVRVLCSTPEVPTDTLSWVAGPAADVAAVLGPATAATPHLTMWFGSRVHPMPTRKRDLGHAVGTPTWSLFAQRLRGGPTAEDWVARWLGHRVWNEGLQGWMDHRLAGPAARAPAGVARRLLGADTHGGWWRLDWDGATRAERCVGAVLDAGGEVLTDVQLHGIEVEHGAIVGVSSEFGFESVEGPLYTDLPPAEIADLLDDDTLTPPHPPLGARVFVEVEGRLAGDVMWVPDGSRRLVGLREAGPHTVAEVVVAPGDPLFTCAADVVGRAVHQRLDGLVSELGSVVAVTRHPDRVACPRPSVEAPWEGLSLRYAALGIQPLGETGTLLPLSWRDELRQLEQAQSGMVVRTQRDRWLVDGPPREPWSPWGTA